MIGRIFLGRYEATRLLGEGGMGRVFLARQLDLPDRQVVIKVMHDHIAADVKFRERFLREIQLMGKFQHPYAVTLYDFSLDDPQGPCIIMEYVKGVNLDKLLEKNGRFTPARVGRLLGQLCEALQAAHSLGIVHRDLKPANLMIVDADTPREKVKVMDFGLARAVDAASLKKVTETNVDFAIGTPAYICPEQVRGEPMDRRGDLYAVGVLAFELLTGRLPFPGPDPHGMLLAHATEPPPSFEDVGAGDWVPPAVEQVVLRCLEKDPADRPQSAHELSRDYETALANAGAALPPPTPVLAAEETNGHGPDRPFQPTYTAPPDDPNAIQFILEAWMPQVVAMVKLRGYVHDVNGEVLASEPGLVKVRLPGTGSVVPGRMSWFGLGRRAGPIVLELHLQQTEGRESQLHITVRFRPGDSTPATDQFWRARCVAHFINLRGYMIGNTAAMV
jgi:eukaryotic-like serine/threonine-protein kinase